jgi:ATP-dependent DNA helicase RecQ
VTESRRTLELCSAVAACSRPVSLADLRRALGQSAGRTLQAVGLLQSAGAVRLSAEMVIEPGDVGWPEIAARVEAELEQRSALLRTRRQMIDAYVEGESCRWAALTAYLEQAEIGACGHCDVCQRSGQRRQRPASARRGRVTHPEFGDGSVINDDGHSVTVLFDAAGYRTLSKELLADPAVPANLRHH